jgi:hypothetical protein
MSIPYKMIYEKNKKLRFLRIHNFIPELRCGEGECCGIVSTIKHRISPNLDYQNLLLSS